MTTMMIRTTATNNGRRTYRWLLRDVIYYEPDFITGREDTPDQLRIWHKVWVPQLRRFDDHIELVCQGEFLESIARRQAESLDVPPLHPQLR